VTRPWNFGPGPSALPVPVLERIREDLPDWNASGMSVMEVSHRGADFGALAERCEARLRRLLGVPDGYHVLFLHGGAATQFAAVPLNLMGRSGDDDGRADYVDTGIWSRKAIAEGRRFGRVSVAATSGASGDTAIPPQHEWRLDRRAAYLHYTPNETIGGVEYHWIPHAGDVPLVADMSSTILSRPIDVSRFGVLYAGAQKNLGIAGLAVVVVREDLAGRASSVTPAILDWKVQAEHGSMFNTAPTFAWYVCDLVLEWIEDEGGVEEMGRRNERKAGALYAAIDASDFYANPVRADCRSWMNAPFTLAAEGLDERFLAGAAAAGLVNLKGHRLVGGMRASLYNAIPEPAVDALVEYMREFERRHG